MSVQFGRWHFEGEPAPKDYIARVSATLAQYGPDGDGSYSKGGVNILYHAFHTTKESRREQQPHISSPGAIITWDGRLDNRAELISELRTSLAINSTDVEIVSAAYEKWSTNCFSKLLGDWALSIWSPHDRNLILARDFVGTRQLYYTADDDAILWSTILDPLVLLRPRGARLNKEYIAAWMVASPKPYVTPYVGVHSVPPSSLVSIRPKTYSTIKYWDFDPAKRTLYKEHRDYEDHFRTVFAAAVRRRLRSHLPIAAELSGGIDSSSIVCMADFLIANGKAETPRVDTISYFDNEEPSWNELPFFSIIETKRNAIGTHLDIAKHRGAFRLDEDYFFALPGYSEQGIQMERDKLACFNANGNRVLLSGIGGDEFLGGVPSPIPELADLLTAGRFIQFGRQLTRWSRVKKRPAFALLRDTFNEIIPFSPFGMSQGMSLPTWVRRSFVNRCRFRFTRSRTWLPFRAVRPSFCAGQRTLAALRGRMRMLCLPWLGMYETTYPYLDRDLVEFALSVPSEQLRQPGQRRSLMRRALVDLVPASILGRKRKGYISRRPLECIATDWNDISTLIRDSKMAALGYVDQGSFCDAFVRARKGLSRDLVLLLRALKVELWLRNVLANGITAERATAAGSNTALYKERGGDNRDLQKA
jgi:asparagine synthase (glutamine-hydrolysing)